jgi:hypothetical protein
VNAYKPRFYYWEGYDMVRKLCLVGMLVVAGRGSVAQLFLAVVISFVTFSLQITLQPYKHWEDNLFKAAVEVHIFLLVSVALVLKCLRYGEGAADEVLPIGFYDVVLIGSFVLGIPVGFAATICAKRRMMEQVLQERAAETSDAVDSDDSAAGKRRAIRLLQLGLMSNEDMRLLTAYFAKLDAMVNKMTHVFISYRVASDRQLARRLYDALSELSIDETGQRMRVYLDQTRLEDGQRWDSGFMNGLANSWVFVPIVSAGSVGPMVQLGQHEDWTDNVLLEWAAALELHARGHVKAVLPLLVGQTDFFVDAQTFGGVQALPTWVSAATMEKVVVHLVETTGEGSIGGLEALLRQVAGAPEPTVQGIVASLLKFQGVKLSQSGAASAHSHGHLSVGVDDLRECTGRVQATVGSCLKRVGAEREV